MRRPVLLAALILLASTPGAHAQWITTLSPDNIVCGAPGDQNRPEAVPDGSGGVVSVWNDARRSGRTDLFAQRLDVNGVTLWALDGVAVDTTAGALGIFRACSDDSGGMIVAWTRISGPEPNRVRVQRVDANGQIRWGAGGLRAGLAELVQDMPRLVRDGSGGAFVLWSNWSSGFAANIVAQRLTSAGTRLWSGTGVSLTPDGEMRTIEAVERPGGGVYFAWWQTFALPQVAGIDASGAALWPGGIAITDAPMSNVPPRLVGVAAGNGVVFVCGGGNELYARRIGPGGSSWPTAQRVVSGNWYQSTPAIASDGAGGAIVSWVDSRNFFDAEMYAQRLRFDGLPLWATDGVGLPQMRVTGASGLVSDGAGGVWIASASPVGTWVQRLSASGVPWFPQGGVNLSERYVYPDGMRLVPTVNNGLIVVASGGEPFDIWAKRMFGNGSLGTVGVQGGPGVGSSLALSAGPNPARERVTLGFTIAREGHARLEVFGLRGERIATLANGVLSPGRHARTWDMAGLAPGVYHARLTSDAGTAVATIAHVK